jgi:eukaryotic-like serine/threonine-protein kinase
MARLPEQPSAGSWPERVGPYRVRGRLGAGGVGMVYEAEDEGLHRRVAVKVLHDASPANAARFRREARAMGRLNHPNVPTVYDVGEADGQAYIAMELVRGRTLRQWVAERTTAVRRPSLADVLAVLRQAGAGLQAAHAAGLVHRDFKPDNVLVGHDGRVRVVDFGLAKHHADLDGDRPFDRELLARELADARITRTGSLMGTPAYMAPEQFRGQGDARSDQFSFCVVLYEALTGRLPFPGDTAEALYESTSRGKLRGFPEHVAVPPAVKAVLRRGLSAKAEDRYASMAALLEALEQAVVRGAAEPRRRHKTRGMRSWKWRVVTAAAGGLLAALSSMMQPAERQGAPHDAQHEQVTATTPTEPPAVEVEPAGASEKARRDQTVHTRTAPAASNRLHGRRALAQS